MDEYSLRTYQVETSQP